MGGESNRVLAWSFLGVLVAHLTAGCAGSGTADAPPDDAPVLDAGAEGRAPEASADASEEPGDDAPPEPADDGGAQPDVVDGGAALPDAAPLTPPPGVWTYYTIPGSTCLDGRPGGFGMLANPASQDLMVYFEGGGACFNDACDVTAFNVPFVPPPDGIFNRLNPANPVRDWNMVYVPYCSGDIHGGDNDVVLAGALRHFHGYSNVTKYLERWVPTFASVSRILVTGISAGGFGAGLNVEQIAEAFGPSRQYVLIDDSGPPLSKNAMPPCLQKTFRQTWALDKTILAACGADCPHPDDFARDWIAHIAKKYPTAHAGVFSNTRDSVIRAFMGFGWGNGVYDACTGTPSMVPGDVYQQDLLDFAAGYSQRVSTYFVGPARVLNGLGLWHTVLRSPTYYTTSIDGVSVPAWVSGVIAGNVQHVGP